MPSIDLRNRGPLFVLIGVLSLHAFFLSKLSAEGVWTVHRNQNKLTCVAVHDGIAWCGRDAGVVRWDIRNESYDIYTVPGERVTAIATDSSGKVWAGTTGGVFSFDGSVWGDMSERALPGETSVNCIEIDGDNTVWIGTTEGLSVLSGTNWRHYTRDDNPDFNNVTSIAFGRNGTVWLGAGNDWKGRPCRWSLSEDELLEHAGAVETLRVDRKGVLWESYYSGMGMDYLLTVADDGSHYVSVPGDGLGDLALYAPHDILDFEFDAENTLWLSRRVDRVDDPNKMLSQLLSFTNGTWRVYEQADGLPQSSRDIEVDERGEVYLARIIHP